MAFYEVEALRGGWSLRKLDRQITRPFYTRARRLRIGESWLRVDLLFFHRRLRCLVIIDLKLTELNDTGVREMHMQLRDSGV
ncbi:DUF1016 family protein [Paraburkholderia sp. 1N]|uniref:DUF1016 family protein n=1 Tax=Paraburkholderia solitsugae TaxID=2675748 RepID=A0ABX2BPF3_9BURK|nr:DUF1016 family protein [Paraburkholderia solitsugae]